MPDPEMVKQQLINLRRTRLEMEESRLELEEITAKLEHDIRQKRLMRVRRSLDAYIEELPNSEQQ
jgi:hypothetical protein